MANSNLNTIKDCNDFLESYKPNPKYPDDFFSLKVCKLALQAVQSGNFGVGSLIVDSSMKIVASGYNQVFFPYFRSDRHAEMVVMGKFEDQNRDVSSIKGYILYTSLESCPMCMTRLITSGCEKIIHITDDPLGGMVHLKDNLPRTWIELAQHQTFTQANCSKELEEAAKQIFMLNVEELNDLLKQRANKK